MLQWLLGDICNLIGCVITNQYKVQLYTAYYFVGVDVIMISQLLWYNKFKPAYRKWKGEEDLLSPESPVEHWLDESQLQPSGSHKTLNAIYPAVAIGMGLFALTQFIPAGSNMPRSSRILLGDDDCDSSVEASTVAYAFGIAAAWISGVLYVCARIPQIIHNAERESVEGLELSLFVSSTAANVFYGLSVVLPNSTDWRSRSFWESSFPYLVGSLGTVATTIPIFYQFWKYRDTTYRAMET